MILDAILFKVVSQPVVSAQKLSQRNGKKISPRVLTMSKSWSSHKLGIKGQHLLGLEGGE